MCGTFLHILHGIEVTNRFMALTYRSSVFPSILQKTSSSALVGPARRAFGLTSRFALFEGIISLCSCLLKYIEQDTDRALWISFLGVSHISTQNRTAEVGTVGFGTWLQRTKAAKEIVFVITRLVFEEFGFRRFVWAYNSMNNESKRAVDRYGFVYEGAFRQHRITKWRTRDSVHSSMLHEE